MFKILPHSISMAADKEKSNKNEVTISKNNVGKTKKPDNLRLVNKELSFQNEEKEKRAAELIIVNKELAFQNEEKEKRAAELIIANKELVFQNEEKEKRAAELIIANKELVFQNEEKEKRAAELIIANKELVFQNEEKEKRAAELFIANKELDFQNQEKEKRATELLIANNELLFQYEEKEKLAAALAIVNKELEAFAYVASHDLQEPLRKIQTFAKRIIDKENENLSEPGKDYLARMNAAANRMQALINDILTFSRINTGERKFEEIPLNRIVTDVLTELKEDIEEKSATIETGELCNAVIIPFQFRQLLHNLISNSLKFSDPAKPLRITIKSEILEGDKLEHAQLSPDKTYCHIQIKDNGIGFEPHFNERIFKLFQKLHGKDDYAGTGIGLAIVKRIVENHKGFITANGDLNKSATFNIYLPNENNN